MAANIFDISIEEDKCCICHELLSSAQIYELPECKHKFHTHCIVTWFRHRPSSQNYHTPDGKCPCCRNYGINNNNISPNNINTSQAARRYRLGWYYKPNQGFREKKRALRNYEKTHNGPKQLTSVLTKWDKCKIAVKEAELNYKNFKDKLKTEQCSYIEADKTIKNLQRIIWQKRRLFRHASSVIADFPVVPIIIPTPIDIN